MKRTPVKRHLLNGLPQRSSPHPSRHDDAHTTPQCALLRRLLASLATVRILTGRCEPPRRTSCGTNGKPCSRQREDTCLRTGRASLRRYALSLLLVNGFLL